MSTNNYWDDKAMTSLIEQYQSASSLKERNDAFALIYPALYKLSEYYYNEYKIAGDRRTQIESMLTKLTLALDRFDKTKTVNSFYFFNQTARFYKMTLVSKENKIKNTNVSHVQNEDKFKDVFDLIIDDKQKAIRPTFYVDTIKANAESQRMRSKAKVFVETLNNSDELIDVLCEDHKYICGHVKNWVRAKCGLSIHDYKRLLHIVSYKFEK